MGKIVIEEMEFYAFHGHYQEEQIVGNRFLVDLELSCNLAVPATSDSLNDAVNYQQAYQIIKNEMRRTKSNLLENIGKREATIGRYAVVFGQLHRKPALHSPALDDNDFRAKR